MVSPRQRLIEEIDDRHNGRDTNEVFDQVSSTFTCTPVQIHAQLYLCKFRTILSINSLTKFE